MQKICKTVSDGPHIAIPRDQTFGGSKSSRFLEGELSKGNNVVLCIGLPAE